MPTEQIVNWTCDDIDAAITVHRARHAAALERGDLAAAEHHEGWVNKLLDARPHHRST